MPLHLSGDRHFFSADRYLYLIFDKTLKRLLEAVCSCDHCGFSKPPFFSLQGFVRLLLAGKQSIHSSITVKSQTYFCLILTYFSKFYLHSSHWNEFLFLYFFFLLCLEGFQDTPPLFLKGQEALTEAVDMEDV